MSSTNEWPVVKLGKLVEKTSETKGGSDIPVYSITKHAGFVSDYFKKNVHSQDQSKYKVVNEGEFAYATIHLDEGSIGIAPEKAAVSPMYTTFRIVSADIDPQFLLRFLKSDAALAQYAILGTGSIERRKNINFEAFSRLTIPLPPLAEQQRITKILDKIALNNGLKTSILEKLSELEASMFENLAKQNRSATAPLSSLNVDFIAGKNIVASGESSHPLNQVVKVSAVSSGTFDPTEAKPLPADYSPPEKHRIGKGDILFGRASGSLELIGATCLVTQDVEHLYLPDKVWKLKVGAESPVDPLFVYYALRGARSRSYFQNQASGASGVRNISKQKVLQLEIPVPSPEDQRSFLNNAAHIRETKLQTKKSLALGEELQDSLSIRAFAGRL